MKKMFKKITKKQWIIIGILALLIIAGLITLLLWPDKEAIVKKIKKKPENEETINIVDVNSNTRPYAVMINNINVARGVQSGLSKAYIVYEIIVEGGITRYLALFKDADVERIGSIRSARHYYLDYVMENDAIYIHWGYSPQAQSDLKTFKIDTITSNMNYFFRDTSLNVSSEHTLFTTSEMLDKAVENKELRSTTDKGLLLSYSAKALDLSKFGEVSDANKVTIKYSSYLTDVYEYDESTKMYKRFVNDGEQIDHMDDTPLNVKNIIIYDVENHTIAGDEKGRQEISNIGSGNGYYVSEGKAIKITWEKSSRESRTIYRFEDGSDLKVNDGNTFIQIMPSSGTLNME